MGLIIRQCNYQFSECVNRLKREIDRLGATMFAEIDHSSNAIGVGMSLEPTIVLYFGNPRVGTPLMKIKREAAYELPLRVLVWAQGISH